MFRVFAQAFRTPDLRSKLLFMLGMIVLFRIGSILPTPGVDVAARYGLDALREQLP